jgi:hypothetical protein
MSSGLRRGEIYRVRQPQHGDPKKSRCFAVVSRQDFNEKGHQKIQRNGAWCEQCAGELILVWALARRVHRLGPPWIAQPRSARFQSQRLDVVEHYLRL